MKDNSKILNTLEEVQKWVFKMQKEENKIIYRGQGNSEWQLNSTFSREEFQEKIDNDQKKTLNDFKYLINYTEKKIVFLKDELGKDIDNFSLFGKMQHYGRPTPLIDFTEDILIALWFAASSFSKNNEKNIKIFYKDLNKEEFKSEVKIEDIKFEELLFFKFKTNQKFGRSMVQKSVFLFDTLNLDHKFKFIEIDKKIKLKIIKWLDNLGININYLFPDDEGVFQSFNFLSYEKYFFDGIREFENGNNKKSLKKFKKAIELKPDFAEAYLNWGCILNELGKYEKAMEKFKIATKIKPNFVEAYSNWGYSLNMLGRYEEAIEKLEKAVEIKPNYSDAYLNWGVSLNGLHKYEDAIEKNKISIEIEPNYADSYLNWGCNLNELGKYEEAIEMFKIAIKLKPNFVEAYSNWASVLNILDRYEEAIEKLEKAVEIKPDYANAYFNWGFSLIQLTKYKEAIEKFKIAIDLKPGYINSYLNWGICLTQLGKTNEAIKKLEKVIELKPDHVIANNLLLAIKEKMK